MKFKMEGFDEYDNKLAQMSTAYEPMCKAMLKVAVKIVKAKLQAANNTFSKYVRGQAAKRSRYGGWYAKVGFGGTKGWTSGNTYPARAATVYEYGRTGGTYEADYFSKYVDDEKAVRFGKHTHSYPDQPARPFIRRTIDEAAPEVVEAMQQVYDEEVAKIFR